MRITPIATIIVDQLTSKESISAGLDNYVYSPGTTYDVSGGHGQRKSYILYDHRPDTSYWESLDTDKQRTIIEHAALLARIFEYNGREDFRFVSLADAITMAVSQGKSPLT